MRLVGRNDKNKFMKKYKIIIIACLVLIIAAGGFWYYGKNTENNKEKQKEKIAFDTGFIMLDDEKSLVWSEAIQLSLEARTQFENKIKEIQADLAVKTEKDDRLADYNNLAVYQKYLGNYRESYNAYLESLKLENQARISWQNFADVLLKMKALKSAETAYKKAVELNKYIPESYVKLADYYKAVNDGVKVEATYKSGLEAIKESMESDSLVLNAYAEWLILQNKYDQAIEIYEQLIVKQPANKAALEKKIENIKK